MSITSEEAAAIRAEQAILKDSVSQVVEALHENTKVSGEMLLEMRERDVRDEYRDKEFNELKEAVSIVDNKIDDYIKSKQPILDWTVKRKEFYESILKGMTSTYSKIAALLIIVAIAAILGIDLTKLKIG